MVTIALIGSLAWLTPTLAQTPDKGSKDDAKSQTTIVKKEKVVTIDGQGNRKEYNSEQDQGSNDDKHAGQHKKTVVVTQSQQTTADNDSADLSKMVNDAVNSLKAVDWDQISKQVDQAMASIDWNEIHQEIADAQKQFNSVDWPAIKNKIDERMDEVNEKINDPKVREEVKIRLDEAKKEADKAIQAAKKQMAAAKVSTQNAMSSYYNMSSFGTVTGSSNSYANMLLDMEQRGLIDHTRNYKIEKEDGVLYINGKKQPSDVYDRYKKYLDAKKIVIKGNGKDLTINVRR